MLRFSRSKLTQLVSTLAIALVGTLASLNVQAQSQDYPNRSIKFLVPYSAGTTTDVIARLYAQKLGDILGQTVVVDNKSGAGGNISADATAKAAPDGYTLSFSTSATHATNPALYANIPFDPIKDFTHIALMVAAPNMLAINPKIPATNMAELIAYAKANPGKVSYGSSGVGSAAHLASELLAHTAGIEMVHIPYKGTAPALADLVANNIQMLVDVPSSMMPHVNSGKINGIGMFAKDRLPAAKDVPTLPESGGPAIEASSWVMFLAPGNTPPDIVNKLSQAVHEVVESPELKARFIELGIIPVGSSSAEATAFLKDEIQKWGQVIKTANVKPE